MLKVRHTMPKYTDFLLRVNLEKDAIYARKIIFLEGLMHYQFFFISVFKFSKNPVYFKLTLLNMGFVLLIFT